MRARALFIAFVAFLSFGATAQSRIQALEKLVQKAGIPGLSLAYVRNGKVAETYSLGVQGAENGLALNDSTVFSAASLSKSIFAYMVFRLVQTKKLDLDKPLLSYHAYKDVLGDAPARQVTARMVLRHTPGLPNWRDGDSLHFILPPGQKFRYSGEGFVWLSKIVEHITGKSIEALAHEKLFLPLGMRHTGYVWQPGWGQNFAYPHIDVARSVGKYFPDQPNVAQSLQTTAQDYGRFLAHILQDKAFMKMWQVDTGSHVAPNVRWAMGLGRETTTLGPAFFQWGDNGTFKAFLIGYPERREGLVYFANSYHGLKIARDVLKLYFPGNQPALDWLEADSADAPELQVFQHAQNMPVAEAVAPYSLPGKDRIDTARLSLKQITYLASRFLQLKHFDKAADLFRLGLQVDSGSAALWAGQGETLLRQGYRERALISWQKAARLDPGNATAATLAARLAGKKRSFKSDEKVAAFALSEYIYARHVTLVGSFNGWNDLTEPMRWENGAWRTELPLKPGSYQYKFVVDGVWLPDPKNSRTKPGSMDSELEVS